MTLMALLLSTGCTTFSRQECREMDWRQTGYNLALKGNTQNQARDFSKKECSDNFGIQPNYQALIAGYDSGIKKFCTPEFSHQFALEGGIYQGTCPESVEEKVVAKYSDGRVKFLEQTVQKLKSEISSLENQVSRLKSENSDLEAKVRSLQ
jgi:hypothetical protein